MKIAFTKPGLPGTGVVVVGVSAGGKFTASAEQLDKKTGGMISRAVKGSRFKGDKGQNLAVVAPSGTRLESAILVGLGKPDEMTTDRAQALGGEIYALIGKSVGGNAAICVDKVSGMPLSAPEIAANVGYGARLRSYRFDKYRTKEKKEDKPSLKSLGVHVTGADRARKDFAVLDKIADGVFFTRDLVSEPANVLYPETLAKEAKTLERLGVKVDVLGVTQMKRLGMGSLLGVGQGSVHEPRLVAMRWDGAGRGRGRSSRADAPVAFVGKGVTFDSGGISIKPAANMEDMKWDMGGAGVVIGLMKALAGRKAKVNAVGVVGLVENLPSATAQRPGDVVKTMSGQTIEVINTDAEGRLVLADALHYCNDRFKPKLIVDLATLTGAIIISLGNEHAGLFSNDDRLAERLTEAGTAVGEKLWRMPLGEAYDKMIKSDIADMKNIGNRGAGSITAAQLLQRFVGKTPWAHLDIAGVTWSKSDSALVPKGGTAFGVRLLNEFVSRNYEKK